MKRYDVHWVRLDPVEGGEIGKTRLAAKLGSLSASGAAALRELLGEMFGKP